MPHAHRSTRRRFLADAAQATAAAALLPKVLWSSSPNDKPNIAFIGCGGRGARNLLELTKTDGINVTALCDVNARNLDKAGKQFPQARKFVDFRELYDKASDVDAVVVSTTEHTHAYATLPALQLGKPVYCEKPLTWNIHEARVITQAAKHAGVPTQMGTQIHARPNYHRVVELIQSGAIGDVTEAHVWVSRAWGLQTPEEAAANNDKAFVTKRPAEGMKPPAHLNWDLWIGPAPWRPYHDAYFPGPRWYRWWDFGNGTMSDLGSHWNDLPFWALNLDAPRTIEAVGPEPHPEIAPASMTAIYEYGPRDSLPACRLTWYQGTHKPLLWLEGAIPKWSNGVLFIGSKGMLLADYGKHVLLPEEKFRDFERPAPTIPPSPGHQLEWLAACHTGGHTGSPFSYAGPLTEANHLGNVAFRVGRKIEWDAAAMRATNCPEAEQFIRREPRAGWSLTADTNKADSSPR